MEHPMALRGNVTRAEFERMWREGILDRSKQFDLIRGEIVVMTPEGGRHAWTVTTWQYELMARLGREHFVWVGHELAIAPDLHEGNPQPDLAVVEGPRGDDNPSSALLVIEISDSTVRRDRRRKVPMYAFAQIPEVWITNLDTGQLEVYREPMRGSEGWWSSSYRSVTQRQRHETVTPLRLPNCSIPLDTIFP